MDPLRNSYSGASVRPIRIGMQPEGRPAGKTIATYMNPRALAPRVRAALRGLGYELVAGSSDRRTAKALRTVDLRLVDDRQLDQLPSPQDDPATPVILLTGSRPAACDDPRVRGRVPRPAALPELYRAFQESLEANPRSIPRVRTRLSARCLRRDQRWLGAVTSLSEQGCLFRSSEDVRRGMRLSLQLWMPMLGMVSARAECTYRTDDSAGLLFQGLTVQTREAIGAYVTQRLAIA